MIEIARICVFFDIHIYTHPYTYMNIYCLCCRKSLLANRRLLVWELMSVWSALGDFGRPEYLLSYLIAHLRSFEMLKVFYFNYSMCWNLQIILAYLPISCIQVAICTSTERKILGQCITKDNSW